MYHITITYLVCNGAKALEQMRTSSSHMALPSIMGINNQYYQLRWCHQYFSNTNWYKSKNLIFVSNVPVMHFYP